jgi:acetylornithine/N-succinyldiaminopimelate aminotransferase
MNDPTSTSWEDRYAASLMNAFGPPKLVLSRGEGARVWDEDGKAFLDLFGGIAVNALGHNHPALVSAVHDQLSTLGHISNFFASRPQIELAEKLLDLLLGPAPSRPTGGRVFFSNSGAEANEAAFKLTRRTGRSRIVAAEGAFHGRTMGSLALTAKEAYRTPFEPLPGEVSWVPYGDADALAAAVDDDTAAVILEPIQGEAGVVVPPDGYLAAARQAATDHGALLWIDEVQSGIGRTGRWFAHQAERELSETPPDIVTLAKGLGGGIPIGATIATGAVGGFFEPGNHGTTFGGNPVACAAALAVLGVIEDQGLLEEVEKVGKRLSDAVAADPAVTTVRGRGLLIGADLDGDDAAAVVDAGRSAGFLLNNTGPATLRFAPPLVLTDNEVAEFGDAWPGILREAHASRAES